MKRKAALIMFLKDMYEVMGSRGAELCDAIEESGEVLWPKLCPYKFTYKIVGGVEYVDTVSRANFGGVRAATKINIEKTLTR